MRSDANIDELTNRVKPMRSHNVVPCPTAFHPLPSTLHYYSRDAFKRDPGRLQPEELDSGPHPVVLFPIHENPRHSPPLVGGEKGEGEIAKK
jgi:hypothetical protein